MNRIFKQALIGLFFAGQLVTVWALNRAGTEKLEDPLAPELALQRYGFYLRDHAKEAGLNFTHGSPQNLDKDLRHILPIIASMGASVSVVDFDRDGLLDVYVVNSREGGKNKLFRNLGNGKFRDVAEKMGVADLNRREDGCCMGAVWGDYDNDGFEDLLVYRWGRVDLYRNDRGKGFVKVSEKAGMPEHVNANS